MQPLTLHLQEVTVASKFSVFLFLILAEGTLNEDPIRIKKKPFVLCFALPVLVIVFDYLLLCFN